MFCAQPRPGCRCPAGRTARLPSLLFFTALGSSWRLEDYPVMMLCVNIPPAPARQEIPLTNGLAEPRGGQYGLVIFTVGSRAKSYSGGGGGAILAAWRVEARVVRQEQVPYEVGDSPRAYRNVRYLTSFMPAWDLKCDSHRTNPLSYSPRAAMVTNESCRKISQARKESRGKQLDLEKLS